MRQKSTEIFYDYSVRDKNPTNQTNKNPKQTPFLGNILSHSNKTAPGNKADSHRIQKLTASGQQWELPLSPDREKA